MAVSMRDGLTESQLVNGVGKDRDLASDGASVYFGSLSGVGLGRDVSIYGEQEGNLGWSLRSHLGT